VKLFASKTLSVGVAALACLLAAPARAGITYEMVTVGNAGNAGDTRVGPNTLGKGAVAYDYQIGKYDVTIGQYAAFLNAVAAMDSYELYHSGMGADASIKGISRTVGSGGFTYSVIGSANRPITYVNWFDAARFANWMANGQPTGGQDSTTTENGAYDLSGSHNFYVPARNATNPNTNAAPAFYIPTENEWYKAAYYSPTVNGGSGGYYAYATQSNTAPGNVIGSTANQANYYTGAGYSVTQSLDYDYSDTQNYLTVVGAFSNSASFYGTFDQSGNVSQWNDLDGTAGITRGLRGGSWSLSDPFALSSSSGDSTSGGETLGIGFRLAGPAASGVPEIDPSSFGSALALVLGSLGLFERRRAR
jgi:formylglycine-generating enzyme